MKILVLTDDYPPHVAGGAGVIAARLSHEFVQQGHEVRVVSNNEIKSKYHDRWRSYVSLYNPFAIRVVKKALKEFKPDVVLAHNIHTYISYYSLVVAKRYARVYMTAHDIMPFYPGTFTEFIGSDKGYKVTAAMQWKKFKYRYNPFRNVFIRFCLSKIDKIIAVSNELKIALEENGIRNITVIYNGIDIAGWNVVHNDSQKILFQGRLSGAKGGELILHILRKVIKEVPQAELVVVGKKDAYAERMLVKAKELGVSQNIRFTGWVDTMQKQYEEASVVVIPSVCFDCFPNGTLEGFAAGKPVIATCFGGASEIVEDGINGYIVNPFDTDLFAQRLVTLLKDRRIREQFGGEGRKLIESKYRMSSSANKYIELWKMGLDRTD